MSANNTFQDDVIEKAHTFARDVVAEAVKRYPRPPGLRKLTKQEQLQEYLSLTPQKMQELIQTKGPLEVEKYIAQMEHIRQSGV